MSIAKLHCPGILRLYAHRPAGLPLKSIDDVNDAMFANPLPGVMNSESLVLTPKGVPILAPPNFEEFLAFQALAGQKKSMTGLNG